MKFCWEGNQIMLRGDPFLSQMEASLKVILKAVRSGEYGFMVKMVEVGILEEAELSVISELPMRVETLLE